MAVEEVWLPKHSPLPRLDPCGAQISTGPNRPIHAGEAAEDDTVAVVILVLLHQQEREEQTWGDPELNFIKKKKAQYRGIPG